MANNAANVDAHGQLMLLESLLDQATRHAISMLSLRVRLGRLQERLCQEVAGRPEDGGSGGDNPSAHVADFANFDRARTELVELRLKIQTTFSIVGKLSARTLNNEPSSDMQLRSRCYEFLRTCFSDILTSSYRPKATATRRHALADALLDTTSNVSLSLYDAVHCQPEQHRLWSLIRPNLPPNVVVQLFLSMSAQIAQVPRKEFDEVTPLRVGPNWYILMAHLLVQLALSAHAFGEYTTDQVLQAVDLVRPDSSDRSSLYPLLWNTTEKNCVDDFDRLWKDVRRKVAALNGPAPEASAVDALYRLNTPHDFCLSLYSYIGAALDYMQPPLLDVYHNIRETGNVPRGFFETPDQSAELPVHPQLVEQDSAEDADSANLLLLDPFSPQAPFSVPRVSSFPSAELGNDDNAQSPSERVAQSQAYHAMAMSVKRRTTGPPSPRAGNATSPGSPTEIVLLQRACHTPARSKQTLLPLDGHDSGASDVEMSPSQHAAIKRHKSNDFALLGDMDTTPPTRKDRADISALEGNDMDIENTAVIESPSALLSARRDRRVRAGMQRTEAPPALQLAPAKKTACATNLQSSSAAMETTPESRKEKTKYVADWTHGDITGGGRLHRNRHEPNAPGTPNFSRANSKQPPPQTLLSPRNIAAARRHNVELDTLIARAAAGDTDAAAPENIPRGTPHRSRDTAGLPGATQITPEHQVGPTADIRARSASRYVPRKEVGDMAGGGRRHRKRQRDGNDAADVDF